VESITSKKLSWLVKSTSIYSQLQPLNLRSCELKALQQSPDFAYYYYYYYYESVLSPAPVQKCLIAVIIISKLSKAVKRKKNLNS
jgi:hypothetical protein